jgi:hypothetical protein
MSKKRYTAQQVIDALEEAKGYVSVAASHLRCDPQTVYNYANEFPSVQRAWDAIREERHDSVESALAGRIKAGDTTAIIFYLKTQAKQRGYVERQEVQHESNEITFRVVRD